MEEGLELSGLLEAAVATHEMFLTFVEGGFTEYQALIIVAEMIKNRT